MVPVVNGTEEGDPIRLGDLPDPDEIHASAPPSRFIGRSPSSLYKRWNPPDCYPIEGEEDLDHNTTDQAKAGLMTQCGSEYYVKPGHSLYTVSGCVVAYFCHWQVDRLNRYDTRCTSGDALKSFRAIDHVCGVYKPGQRREEKASHAGNPYDIAYGVESFCTSLGHNFCGMGP